MSARQSFSTARAVSWGVAAACAAAAMPSSAAGPSTEFSVTGAILTPKVYRLQDLMALPSITQSVSFTAGGVSQSHTYTGAGIWGIVNAAGVLNDRSPHNDGLNKVVLATGSDGYKVVYSMGELDPNFGNRPDIVAYAETINGKSVPLTGDGFARTTAPGDIRGGRYLSNLTSLDVRASTSSFAASAGGVSTQFKVSGDVLHPGTFDLAALQALPTVTRTIDSVVYRGVSFWDLINTTAGISVNPAVNNDALGKYVVATGSDGYRVVFSIGELSANFGNQPDVIAYDADGTGLGANGFARLVVPNDAKKGRWVSNLVSLEVLTAAPAPVPEPKTLATMAGGLAVLFSVAAQRRRALAREQDAR